MTRQSFRKLLILELIIGIIILIVSFATEKYLPSPLTDYLEAEKNAEVTMVNLILFVLSIIFTIAYIVIYIGLYKFQVWAKTLLLPIQIIGLLLVAFYNPSINTGIVNALGHLYSIVVGGILFLVYLSPVREMFGSDNIT